MGKNSEDDNAEYLSLKDYCLISKRILKKGGLPLTDDNIGWVNHMMILADYRFNPKVGITRRHFRNIYARYARKTILKKIKEERVVNEALKLEFPDKEIDLEKFLAIMPCKKQRGGLHNAIQREILSRVRTANINQKEKNVLLLKLETTYSTREIGKRLGFKEGRVYNVLKRTANKFRSLV